MGEGVGGGVGGERESPGRVSGPEQRGVNWE
jgi:hypothetical protein